MHTVYVDVFITEMYEINKHVAEISLTTRHIGHKGTGVVH